jgi:alkyldihydroxyacetonephosphate synthase
MSGSTRIHRWWGWGAEDHVYDMDKRPAFWPWIRERLFLADDRPLTPCVPRASIRLPERRTAPAFEADLQAQLHTDQVHTSDDERLRHSFGRSYRDLVRLRNGLIHNPTDMVLYPQSSEDVERIVQLAVEHDVCLIPFGGGTNIVGCLEPKDRGSSRMTATLDLRRMDRLLNLDECSATAEFEAGVYGPELEAALQARGFALGHHPDSFQYSTLGGWIATRSAGTHSNVYGKIEDMIVSLRLVTPTGLLMTRTLPAASTGPDLNRLIAGSEGTLGIVTQATMRVHPIPEHVEYRMVLFPSFEEGCQALQECIRRDAMPSMARISDELETEMIFISKHPAHGVEAILGGAIKRWLRYRGYTHPAALFVGFEGTARSAGTLRREVMRLLARHRGFDLGTGAGHKWTLARYDVPYLRDYLMDYEVILDSFETSTVWSNVMPLYHTMKESIGALAQEITGFPAYVGCHISHLYRTGACLYFTVAVRCRAGTTPTEMLDQYNALKSASTAKIVQHGGATSHHHAIGIEHQPWLQQEISPVGLKALRAMKDQLDPMNLMNPGTLLGEAHALPNAAVGLRRDAGEHLGVGSGDL